MTRDKFIEIYDCVIKPTAMQIVNIRNTEINKSNFSFCDNFGGLYERYLLRKNSLRIILKKDTDRLDQILDRHKVSASLVVAISESRLISDNSVNEPDDGGWYDIHSAHRVNEQVAFWSGVSTMMMYMTTECEHYLYSEGAIEKIKRELEANGMIFPPPLNGMRYEDSAIRGLFYSGSFYCENPILLANTFFWMEQYFYKHIGVEVSVKQDKRESIHP